MTPDYRWFGWLIVFLMVMVIVFGAVMAGEWRNDAERYCDQLGGVYDGIECRYVSPR